MKIDEVSIPRDEALRMARLFRSMGEDNFADMLDPQPSLDAEIRDILTGPFYDGYDLDRADRAVVRIKAVVRKHIEGLTFWYFDGRSVVERNSVLTMLGGDDE